MGRHKSKTLRRIGSRAQVWHGTKDETTGGLKKKDLTKNKHGSIVSKKKQALARRQKHLEKAGYKPQKGKFVLMRKNSRHQSRSSRYSGKHSVKKRTTRRRRRRR